MDAKSVRMMVNENTKGVLIRMIDGTEFHIPHRDYVWFTPNFEGGETRLSRPSTSFWLHDAKSRETRLINALMIKEIVPLKQNSNGHGKAGKSKKKG